MLAPNAVLIWHCGWACLSQMTAVVSVVNYDPPTLPRPAMLAEQNASLRLLNSPGTPTGFGKFDVGYSVKPDHNRLLLACLVILVNGRLG